MHARSDTDLLAVQQAPAPIARRKADAIAARRQWWARAAERVHLEFRPAGWLLITLGILRLWLKRPRLGKRTVFGLACAFVPPKLNLAAGGELQLRRHECPGEAEYGPFAESGPFQPEPQDPKSDEEPPGRAKLQVDTLGGSGPPLPPGRDRVRLAARDGRRRLLDGEEG